MAAWSRPSSARPAPPASRSWTWTRSTPVTSSVTVCSTWMRALASMKLTPLGRTLGVEVDQQLHRAHPAVAQGLAEPHRGRRHLLPQLVGQVGRRRDLDQLLAPPLEAALPRVEVDHGARAVAHELDLDVPGPRDEALQVERAVAEGRGRLARAGRQRRIEVLGPRDRPHPPPTAPGDGLHHHGRALAERGQEGVRLVRRGRALGARQHGEAAARGQRRGPPPCPPGRPASPAPARRRPGRRRGSARRTPPARRGSRSRDGRRRTPARRPPRRAARRPGRPPAPVPRRGTARSARRTASEPPSSSAWTATVSMSSSAAARRIAQRHLPAVGHEQPSDAPHAASLAEPALPRSCPRITHSAVASADVNVRCRPAVGRTRSDRVRTGSGGQATASSRRLTPRIVRRSRHSGSAASSTWGKRRISVPMAICASARASAAPRQ